MTQGNEQRNQPLAFSYTRFSTPDQMQGDSARRQLEKAQEYADRHSLILDNRTFQDFGVSAYSGENARQGALADFVQAVKDGEVPEGSYLIIENLDRLSRKKPRWAVRQLEDICDRGVRVVTLSDGRVYDQDSLDDDPMAFMWAFMVAIRAHEESEQKANRLASAWQAKRQRADSKPLTAKAPAWLRLNDSEWQVIEDRAKVVRQIYEWAAQGVGQHAIAERLNRQGVPTFSGARYWHRSYVKKLLDNDAVIGRFTPHRIEYHEGKRVRIPEQTVENYFPAIVDRDTWETVAARRSRSKAAPPQRKGRVAHLLAGLATCPHCGSTMTRVVKGSGHPKLVCARAKAGAGCQYVGVNVDQVEHALTTNAAYWTMRVPSGDETLDEQLEDVRAKQEILSDQIENLSQAIAEHGNSRALREKLATVEQEQAELQAQEHDLAGRASLRKGLSRRIQSLREALEADSLDREQTNAILRELLDRVVVNYDAGDLEFEWRHGGDSSLVFAMPRAA